MGPIALFDKSFLQSLSLDESVWFDHFFIPNVCPLFYVETLADLQKAKTHKRTPEAEVRIIAQKFPEMSGAPCAYHGFLCMSELLGRPVPLVARIPLMHGRAAVADGQKAVLYSTSPEEDAFARWQRSEFSGVERLYASIWRGSLSAFNLRDLSRVARTADVAWKSCKALSDALELARSFLVPEHNPIDALSDLMDLSKVPPECREWVHHCWNKAGGPPVVEYAPYASHIMLIDLFFAVALGADLISDERASNRVDIAYLYYLPFCHIFVSSDRLHRRCTDLFLRPNQEFVWGPDLKQDLSRLNAHYSELPVATKEEGVMSFAHYPPTEGEYLVSTLWDRYLPSWRNRGRRKRSRDLPTAAELRDQLRHLETAPSVPPGQPGFDDVSDLDMVARQRMVRRKKGFWHQVPKDLA